MSIFTTSSTHGLAVGFEWFHLIITDDDVGTFRVGKSTETWKVLCKLYSFSLSLSLTKNLIKYPSVIFAK